MLVAGLGTWGLVMVVALGLVMVGVVVAIVFAAWVAVRSRGGNE